MSKKILNYLYLITILFFILGFFNIIFAWLGFVCMVLPFIFLVSDKKKTWCQSYCPRSSLFSKLFKGRSLTDKPGPNWLIRGKAKWFMLGYFCFNLFIVFMSTLMVGLGKREPLEAIRFMIAFRLPWEIPQLLDLEGFPDWTVHLSFRIYSMMFTTTVLGLILAWIFRPRTWCTICPINTMSDIALKQIHKDKSTLNI